MRHRIYALTTLLLAWLASETTTADEVVALGDYFDEFEWLTTEPYLRSDWLTDESFFRDNLVDWDDLYGLEHPPALDLDADGVWDYLVVIHHPVACDIEGCDVLVLSGEDEHLTLKDVLHLPVKTSQQQGILWLGDRFLLLDSKPSIVFQGLIDGVPITDFVAERVGRPVLPARLDLGDLQSARHDLNDDGVDEVFLFIDEFTDCGWLGCGSVILSPSYQWSDETVSWSLVTRPITRTDEPWPPDAEFLVSPHKVRGWHVMRRWKWCYVWLGERYWRVMGATFRAIPVQGCFD